MYFNVSSNTTRALLVSPEDLHSAVSFVFFMKHLAKENRDIAYKSGLCSRSSHLKVSAKVKSDYSRIPMKAILRPFAVSFKKMAVKFCMLSTEEWH